MQIIFVFVSFVLIGGFAFYRWFHRIPLRATPFGEKRIISPADGVIWQIIPLKGKEPLLEIEKQFLGKIKTLSNDVENAAVVISIFMSPLDAHVNWSPVEGKIVYSRHTPGSFSFAKSWKSFLNEKNEVLIDTGFYRMKLIQIAGFLARRIECWVNEGERLIQGEPFGMIRFGSQVSLILPDSALLCVKTGQQVKGGETILGVFK